MIRALFTRWASRHLSSLAHEQRQTARDAVKAKARQIRAELGLPPLEIIA